MFGRPLQYLLGRTAPSKPELNPVEFIWAHWKQHELPNVPRWLPR
jgi:hypothetical protein